tara:strand:+ start:144 stop:392 length:249 start_codon:yes stop_codon:yes gene_type:complete
MSTDRCSGCGHKECRCCTPNIWWGGDDPDTTAPALAFAKAIRERLQQKKKKKSDCWACPNAKIKKAQCGICFREWGSMNKEK